MIKNEEGIDLAEAMVAIILIVAAILSVTTLLIKSQVMQADNEAQARATLIVQDHLERSRQMGYHSLVSNMEDSGSNPVMCATTADTTSAEQKKDFTEKLPCSGGSGKIETYITGDFGQIPYIAKQEFSGTEYTVGYHVTRLSANRADELGWGHLATRDGSKCNSLPGTNDLPDPNAEPYVEDISGESGFYPLCTLKHVTVEVSWTDTSGTLKSTSGSWVRAPQIYEEVPPNLLNS